MDSIDFKELMRRIADDPIQLLHEFFPMLFNNLWEHKFQIIVLIVIFYVLKKGTFKIISTMIPDPSKPKRGQFLRHIFLHKVTDNTGRLTRRGKRGNKPEVEKAYYSRRTERAAGVASIVKSFLNIVFTVGFSVIILNQLGITINSNTMNWIVGFISAALAFGMQNIIKDIVNGIQVIGEDQYGVGDYIETQAASGEVVHIGLRTTRIRGEDGTVYHVSHSNTMLMANRTQAAGQLLFDTVLTWNRGEDDPVVGVKEFDFAETTIKDTLNDLQNRLNAVERTMFAKPPEQNPVPIKDVAEVIPRLSTNLNTGIMKQLSDIELADNPDSENVHEARTAIAQAIQTIDTANIGFQHVGVLGIMGSTKDSITVRVEIRFGSPKHVHKRTISSIKQALFSVFTHHDVSVEFEEVENSSVIF